MKVTMVVMKLARYSDLYEPVDSRWASTRQGIHFSSVFLSSRLYAVGGDAGSEVCEWIMPRTSTYLVSGIIDREEINKQREKSVNREVRVNQLACLVTGTTDFASPFLLFFLLPLSYFLLSE